MHNMLSWKATVLQQHVATKGPRLSARATILMMHTDTYRLDHYRSLLGFQGGSSEPHLRIRHIKFSQCSNARTHNPGCRFAANVGTYRLCAHVSHSTEIEIHDPVVIGTYMEFLPLHLYTNPTDCWHMWCCRRIR